MLPKIIEHEMEQVSSSNNLVVGHEKSGGDDGSWKLLRSQSSTSISTSNTVTSSSIEQVSTFPSFDDDWKCRVSANFYLVEHIILPTDTLQGLCIQYRVNARTLKQVNRFSGTSLSLAPKRLVIPIRSNDLETIKVQNRSTEEWKMHKVLAEVGSLGIKEIKAYLELVDWDVKKAISAAKEDVEWEKPSCTVDDMDVSLYYSEGAYDNDSPSPIKHRNAQPDTNDCIANLMKYKSFKDDEEKWEEMSYGSYTSCVNMIESDSKRQNNKVEEAFPPLVVALTKEVKNALSGNGMKKQVVPDFGIELKEMSSNYQ